ncbi:uncharacterized protein STEHIDRAFT_125988 [Stereum hirsutum FP-91666 SS1]|uniref:Ataxin-10 homolog n=1 Tax=Stereum hirsutum (strain FP-91666) TaxID=721885 RepID=R7RZY2_STEHR|nr:uncharacterized protein STEHIDRAFT_125988 [Stereum hirsutum FP-91666 SS1]EIM80460.1 hypothetical protein STEHIDRAFT_125988 [Stereum hirsutum FP-91666 SS1]
MTSPSITLAKRELEDIVSASVYSWSNDRSAVPSPGSLDVFSQRLASDSALRVHLGCSLPSIWPALGRVWSAADASVTADDSEDIAETESAIVSAGKFTRNLVAGVPSNQERVFEMEPHMRRILRHYTSWTFEGQEGAVLVTRILVQAISNIVTDNDNLRTKLWSSYLSVPEEQSILIRLLASKDTRTLLSSVILILNCTHGSNEKMSSFSSTATGYRILVTILDRLEKCLDAPETTEEGKVFELGYTLLSNTFAAGFFPDFYRRLAIKGELVSPPQTTLLKLMDSYLQGSLSPTPAHGGLSRASKKELGCILADLFFSYSAFLHKAIRQFTGEVEDNNQSVGDSELPGASSSPLLPSTSLDLHMPAVCAALVLVVQCIISMSLSEDVEVNVSPEPEQEHGSDSERSTPKFNLKSFLLSVTSPDSKEGLIECLIDDLRQLEAFLPRIQFGKNVDDARGAADADLSETSDNTLGDAASTGADVDTKGFAYLKRDLVRLLGILCHENRDAQGRVRRCGGITVVMNLCTVDERNPYLREHAIFTLRNLLHKNAENQAVVNEIQPMEAWGESGILHDTPAAVGR